MQRRAQERLGVSKQRGGAVRIGVLEEQAQSRPAVGARDP